MVAGSELEMKKTIDAFEKDLKAFRSGRPSADLLNSVSVNCYGSNMPMNQVATVTVSSNSLLIQPFDKANGAAIEKALMNSSLGLNFPPLSEERRKEIVKQIATRAEQARVAIRNERKNANDAIKKSEDSSEDEQKNDMKTVQELTDKHINKIDEMFKAKESEILKV